MTSFRYFNFSNFSSDNVDDGKASSLTSTAKRCAMALIAKVTWNVATKYNFDYKKNLDRERKFNYTRLLINYLGCIFGKSYCPPHLIENSHSMIIFFHATHASLN